MFLLCNDYRCFRLMTTDVTNVRKYLELSAFLLNFATKKVARPNNEHKTIINPIHPAIPAGHYGGGIRTATC